MRTDGVLSPLHSLATWYRTTWAGRRLTFSADWLGHLPEKAAHRLGLLKDRMGQVPRYTARVWSQPKWLRDNPFGSYPVNSLDTTQVLADFDRQLRDLGIDDASRDRVHSLVTPALCAPCATSCPPAEQRPAPGSAAGAGTTFASGGGPLPSTWN